MSDNFELLDKLDELEEENEELKKENEELKGKLYSNDKNVFAELNNETAQSNAMLLDEIEDYKAQIERMKCCGNCKHCILEGVLYCTIKNRDVGNRACNYWELAE